MKPYTWAYFSVRVEIDSNVTARIDLPQILLHLDRVSLVTTSIALISPSKERLVFFFCSFLMSSTALFLNTQYSSEEFVVLGPYCS